MLTFLPTSAPLPKGEPESLPGHLWGEVPTTGAVLHPHPTNPLCLSMPNNTLACLSTDLRPLPDVAMTGTCTRECTEFGHSDTCWMPGQSSPSRRPKNALKLSTFVPYQDRGSQEQVGNGSPRLSEERSTKMANLRLLPTYSAFSNSSHETCKDSPMEEIPLTQTSDFQPATTPSSQTTKREIYL